MKMHKYVWHFLINKILGCTHAYMHDHHGYLKYLLWSKNDGFTDHRKPYILILSYEE